MVCTQRQLRDAHATKRRVLDYERAAASGSRGARAPAPSGQRARRRAGARRAVSARARAGCGTQRAPDRLDRLAALLLFDAVLLVSPACDADRPNVPFSIRSVEWLRATAPPRLVSDVERLYYSMNAPSTGGAALKALPRVGVASTRTGSAYLPPAITPVITPALPAKGPGGGPVRWWPGARRSSSPPSGPTRVTPTWSRESPGSTAPAPGCSSIPVAMSRQAAPARPAGATSRPPLRSHLLAAFNSGFKLQDSGGGFVAFGRTYAPLRDGMATFVRLRDGTADIRSWSGGPTPGPEVEFARQNLPLILQGAQLNPDLSNGALWGATLGNAGPRVALRRRGRRQRQHPLRRG